MLGLTESVASYKNSRLYDGCQGRMQIWLIIYQLPRALDKFSDERQPACARNYVAQGDLQILHKPDQGKRDAAFLTRDASQIHHNQENMTLSCSKTPIPEPPTGRRQCWACGALLGGVLPHRQPRRVADARPAWELLLTPLSLGGSLCCAGSWTNTVDVSQLPAFLSGNFHLGQLGGHGELKLRRSRLADSGPFTRLLSAKELTPGTHEPFFRHTQIGLLWQLGFIYFPHCKEDHSKHDNEAWSVILVLSVSRMIIHV